MKRILLCSLCLLIVPLWACQCAITLNPGEFGGPKGDAGGSTDGLARDRPTPRPDDKNPEPGSDTTTPDLGPIPGASRKMVLVEGKSSTTPSDVKLWIIESKTGQRIDITPREQLQKATGVLITHGVYRYHAGAWTDSVRMVFRWQSPTDVILVATFVGAPDLIDLRLYDLAGKVIYKTFINSDRYGAQVMLGPNNQDIWYNSGSTYLQRRRRAGVAPALPRRLYGWLTFDTTGKVILTSASKARGEIAKLMFSTDDGKNFKELSPHVDPTDKKNVDCAPIDFIGGGILCFQSLVGRAILWHVTPDSQWHPLHPNHNTSPEHSDRFASTLPSGHIVFISDSIKNDDYNIYTFDPTTRKSSLIFSRARSAEVKSHSIRKVGTNFFLFEKSAGQSFTWKLSHLQNGGKPVTIKTDSAEFAPGYHLGLSKTSEKGEWGLVTTRWYSDKNPEPLPSQPGLLQIYYKSGKLLYTRNTWGNVVAQASKDGEFVMFVDPGDVRSGAKPTLVWVSMSTGQERTFTMKAKPGLLSLVP